MKLRVLLNGILPPLRDWERQVLDKVGSALPTSLATAFAEQVREINYVQRHQSGKEINFYRMKDGEANVSAAPKISTPSEEYLLARVRVEQPGHVPVTCQVWVVSGIVFSITCDGPTGKVNGNATAKILDVYSPTAKIDRGNPLLDSINGELRSEYERRVADGRMVGGGVCLLEPGKLRHVVAGGLDYCVLGESIDKEPVLARSEKAETGLFLLNVEDETVRKAASSLEELMNS